MKTFLFSIACLVSLNCLAQPTLPNIENFQLGDHAVYLNLRNPPTQLTVGENIQWDFSLNDLPLDTLIQDFVDPQGTPYVNTFPGSNLAEKNSDNTYAYMNNSNQQLEVHGYVDENRNFAMEFKQPFTLVRRPMTYGDTFTTFPITQYKVNGCQFNGTGSVRIEAIGYGTLTWKQKSYSDVLLMRMDQFNSDTCSLNNDISETHTVVYTWHHEHSPFPLFKLDSVKVSSNAGVFEFQSARVLLEEHSALTVSEINSSSIRLTRYQNTIRLSQFPGSMQQVSVQLLDLHSRPVVKLETEVSAEGSVEISLQNIPVGIYVLDVQDPRGRHEAYRAPIVR